MSQACRVRRYVRYSLAAIPRARYQFADDNGNLHEADINRVAEAGIVNGCGGGNYCPSGQVTREQVAVYFYRSDPYRP